MMAFSQITNSTFLRFQERLLPLIATFSSGAVLGYMTTDNECHKKFQKFHHIAVPQAPNHTFYVYMHNEKSYTDACTALASAVNNRPI
jgi:hypothetical protein